MKLRLENQISVSIYRRTSIFFQPRSVVNNLIDANSIYAEGILIMKHMLYIAFNNTENTLFGVQAKILSQCRAFRAHGYYVDLIERRGAGTIIMTEDEIPADIQRRRVLINNYYFRSVLDKQYQIHDIENYIKDRKYDACYIRYDFSDLGFIRLLKALRRVCGKIVLEFPTYPYDEENKKTFLSRMKLGVDIRYRKELHKYVDYVTTFYAGNETIFEIPVIVIPNGFDFDTMNLVKEELPTDALHIIAVSSMREWHGYERFLEGMKNYYQAGGMRKMVLHLVGNGRECPKYKTIVSEYGLQDHVVFEGAMHGAELDAVYEKCALGIDSLARHRSGIDVLSSLKSREYGAKGLPMINSCKIDILEDDFPYLLRVPADESPINMNDVFAFFDCCYDKTTSRKDIGQIIRSYVEKRTGMNQTILKVVERLKV